MNAVSLLAISAAPTAFKTAASLGSSVTSAFSKMLDLTADPPGPVTSFSTDQASETLLSQLQSWLKDQGVTSEYEFRFTLDEAGQSSWTTRGEGAEQVRRLLVSAPEWLSKLRTKAANLQADQAANSLLSPVTLQFEG